MKVKLYIALNNEMCVNTQLENTLTNYTESNILTQRFVLLRVGWDKNGLLSTKRLHMMI